MISLIYFLIPEVKNYEDIGLKSFLIFLIIVLLFAIKYLYQSKEQGQKEHKEDLKFFDSERQKTVNEISQMFHKISVWIEQINSRNNGK
jgi:hypothetical protein